MTTSINAVAIIPARLASTRLPRKILRESDGKSMLAHVYEAIKKSPLLREVIIATDSEEVLQMAESRGWRAEMTSPQHRSGTDRVHEVAQWVAADLYVNVQGDEPLARPEHLEALLRPMQRPEVMVSGIMTPYPTNDMDNPKAVKVLTANQGGQYYFSGSPIPSNRDRAAGWQISK